MRFNLFLYFLMGVSCAYASAPNQKQPEPTNIASASASTSATTVVSLQDQKQSVATQEIPLAPTTKMILDRAIMVHSTAVFPMKIEGRHTLVARSLVARPGCDFQKTKPTGSVLADSLAMSNLMVNRRPTISWSMGAMAEAHEGWTPAPIVILEPLKNLMDSAYGGLIEDFITFGNHALSQDARILVPSQDLNTYLKTNQELKEQMIGYDPKAKESLYSTVEKQIQAMKGWVIRVDQKKHVNLKDASAFFPKKDFFHRFYTLIPFLINSPLETPMDICMQTVHEPFTICQHPITVDGQKQVQGKDYLEQSFLSQLYKDHQLYMGEFSGSAFKFMNLEICVLFQPLINFVIGYEKEAKQIDNPKFNIKFDKRNLQVWANCNGRYYVSKGDVETLLIAQNHPYYAMAHFIKDMMAQLGRDLSKRSEAVQLNFQKWSLEIDAWIHVIGYGKENFATDNGRQRQKLYDELYTMNPYQNQRFVKIAKGFVDQAHQKYALLLKALASKSKKKTSK